MAATETAAAAVAALEAGAAAAETAAAAVAALEAGAAAAEAGAAAAAERIVARFWDRRPATAPGARSAVRLCAGLRARVGARARDFALAALTARGDPLCRALAAAPELLRAHPGIFPYQKYRATQGFVVFTAARVYKLLEDGESPEFEVCGRLAAAGHPLYCEPPARGGGWFAVPMARGYPGYLGAPAQAAADLVADLRRARRAGVCHGDVKQSNVVHLGGRHYLCDYGCAQPLDAPSLSFAWAYWVGLGAAEPHPQRFRPADDFTCLATLLAGAQATLSPAARAAHELATCPGWVPLLGRLRAAAAADPRADLGDMLLDGVRELSGSPPAAPGAEPLDGVRGLLGPADASPRGPIE